MIRKNRTVKYRYHHTHCAMCWVVPGSGFISNHCRQVSALRSQASRPFYQTSQPLQPEARNVSHWGSHGLLQMRDVRQRIAMHDPWRVCEYGVINFNHSLCRRYNAKNSVTEIWIVCVSLGRVSKSYIVLRLLVSTQFHRHWWRINSVIVGYEATCMHFLSSKWYPWIRRHGNDVNTSGHYIDVIMTTITSQITSLTVVYSIVYSDADQRKLQSSASLAFVWGIHRDRWIPRTKGQLRGKCLHLMTSSWSQRSSCYLFSQVLSFLGRLSLWVQTLEVWLNMSIYVVHETAFEIIN